MRVDEIMFDEIIGNPRPTKETIYGLAGHIADLEQRIIAYNYIAYNEPEELLDRLMQDMDNGMINNDNDSWKNSIAKVKKIILNTDEEE
ncbi:hypothetical protein [Nicoliella lavandulae]|uniref:Uncharacterized protein n=1 Tax=Nicoliella lavandulae TaxID=3082954 RepID=A0ABU8SML8_9LACO